MLWTGGASSALVARFVAAIGGEDLEAFLRRRFQLVPHLAFVAGMDFSMLVDLLDGYANHVALDDAAIGRYGQPKLFPEIVLLL
jgi:hypothetical protein